MSKSGKEQNIPWISLCTTSSIMRSECAWSGTNSPPTRPSTWQLQFGKKSASRKCEPKPEVDVGLCLGKQARSASISEQLLRAVDTVPKEQEELGRECVDELIGRRNVFASEPEWRLRTLMNEAEGGDTVVQDQNGHEDIAAEVKEIIRARFQIEDQAKSMRHVPKHQKPLSRRTEFKNLCRGGLATRPTVPNTFTNNATVNMAHTMSRRHEKKEVRAHMKPSDRETLRAEVRPAKVASRSHRKQQQQHKLGSTPSKKKPCSSVTLPPQQLPMERRYQLRHQAREVRRVHAAEERAMQKLHMSVTGDNNKEEIQEQRRIEEEVGRLTLENQQAAALEERLQHRKASLKSLNTVFDAWNKYVKFKREHETRVAAVIDWRVMKRIVTSWKRFTHRRAQVRAAEQTRSKLVREKHMNDQARHSYRIKHLPSWFYRWTAFVTQEKGLRAAAEDAERRRAQSQRLIERLQRQKTFKSPLPNREGQAENESLGIEKSVIHQGTTDECAPSCRGRPTSRSNMKIFVTNRQDKRELHAWTAAEESQQSPVQVPSSPHSSQTSLTRAPMYVDKVYRAMEQRAMKRKQRREDLKKRYEELNQQKRREQIEQRAARDALLLEQQMEKKARIREGKLKESLALKEKQERREHLLAQVDKAKKHNRRRLLHFYALLPWRKHQNLNERVARNATRWHELRSVYLHWERWQAFVQVRRKVHRRHERARLEEATRHYVYSLQRRALRGLMRCHQTMQARALSVHRQHLWNTLQRSWTHWNERLAKEREHQQKVVFKAVIKMQQIKLRRICARWREVTSEAKFRKELEREKQQLWRKVRGWLDEDE